MRHVGNVVIAAVILIAGCARTPRAPQVDAALPPARTAAPAGTPAPAGSPPPTGNPARPTIWDGVYTAAQATRGERTAYINCFSCHTPADWTTSRFLNPSSDQRLGELFQTISRSMPMDAPGKLSPTQYADIIAYMLRLQGAPAGATELPSVLRELDRIFVARPDARE